MDREIVLSLASVKDFENNRPGDFTTRFYRPLVLDSNFEYGIGLNRIINMAFTWYNINDNYDNRKLRYSSDNGNSFTDIILPSGIWNYERFDENFKDLTKIEDDDGNETYPITITFDYTTFRATITLAENYQLDMTQSNFNDLIGFDKIILTENVNVRPRVPNLNQHLDVFNIHCDLIHESLVDGEDSDIIYSFSTSVLHPSFSFHFKTKKDHL